MPALLSLGRTGRRLLPACAAMLLILGARLHTVASAGSNVPWWDEWDGTFQRLLLPFSTGRLQAADLIAAHNEHRILGTRLLELGLFVAAGHRWQPLLEILATQVVFAAGAVVLLRALSSGLPPQRALALLLAGAVLFAYPSDWEGVSWAFLSQIYLSTMLAWMALVLAGRGGGAGALAAATASALCFGAGLATLLATAAVLAWRALERPHRRALAASAALLLAAAVLLMATMPHPPQNETLRPASLAAFLHAFAKVMAFPGSISPGLLQWVPGALYAAINLRRPPAARDALWLPLAGLALWSVLVAGMLAATRAGAIDAPRYAVLLITIPVLNLACLLRLPGPRPALGLAWLTVLALALVHAAPRIRGGIATKQQQARMEAAAVGGWLERHDPSGLAARDPHTFPPSATLRALLEEAGRQRILRPPVDDRAWRKPVGKAGTLALLAGTTLLLLGMVRLPAVPLARLAARLPNRLLARQFAQFAAIGVLGFLCDTAFVTLTAPLLGPYAAGIASYFVVVTINWWLNRTWTYRERTHDALAAQWARFVAANALGFALNRGTYVLLVATSAAARAHLVIPVAAGAVAGMFVNFFLTRRLVFR